MSEITRDVVVSAPLRFVYDAWTQFETYPQFLEGVDEVSVVDPKHLHWRTRGGNGSEAHEWDVSIVEQAPDDRLVWAAGGGPVRGGAVLLDALADGKTRVRFEMDVAEEAEEQAIMQRAERDLQSFKAFIEARAQQLGGWEGSGGEATGHLR